MSERQGGFVEAFADPRLGRNGRLEAIDALIDWRAIEPIVAPLRPGETGRPPYRPLMMMKALYLAALYDLSDLELEQELCDRVSFRRFVGLDLDERAPDATTICRFRTAAAEAGAVEACFNAITAAIEDKGLVLKKGTLIDATLVAARRNRPRREEGYGKLRDDEEGADWTKDSSNNRAFFGYRLHAGVDEGSLIVRRASFTSARHSETRAADALICGDEKSVYADRAYEDKERRRRLRAAGVKDRIMHRRHKYMGPLPPLQAKRNWLIARRRAPVESVFSVIKRILGFRRARLKDLARNAADAFLVLTAYNLRRMRVLAAR